MIGARSGDRVVGILKDVILGTIAEIVQVGVRGWGVSTLVHLITTVRMGSGFMGYTGETHVVSFLLEPVEGGLGTIGAVTGRGVHNAVRWIGTTSARDLWLGQRNGRSSTGDVTLESIHVI